MKAYKTIALLSALFLAGIGGAWAHGWHNSVGVYVGPPYFGPYFGPAWGPGWYPPPYYYPPQPVVVLPPAQPQVYVEQGSTPAAPAAAGQQYWYYCNSGKAYYPYVKECPDGWQKVLPQPEK